MAPHVANLGAVRRVGLRADAHAQVDLSFADFRKARATMKAQGYRMTDASSHILNKKPVFSGIWQKV